MISNDSSRARAKPFVRYGLAPSCADDGKVPLFFDSVTNEFGTLLIVSMDSDAMEHDDDILPVAFGERCKALRHDTGMSQMEFSNAIGMDRSYYASIEVGRRNVTLSSLAKIAGGLGITLSELLDDVEPSL